MPEFKKDRFLYRNTVTKKEHNTGALSAPDKSGFDVAPPPEFGGPRGSWSPEDLFVAAINTCIMTTFLHFAGRRKIDVLGYLSDAEGVLEKVDNKLAFSKVTIKPKIRVKVDHVEDAKKLLTLSEKHCLISNSVKSEVVIVPTIEPEKA